MTPTPTPTPPPAAQPGFWMQLLLDALSYAQAHWLFLLGLALLIAVCVALVVRYHSAIRIFTSEVRTELSKATWPWDPKEQGFKRYKELVDSTMEVVVAMLLLAGYISFCDLCLTSIISFLTSSPK